MNNIKVRDTMVNEYDKLKSYILDTHDIVCNQKYNDTLPYSFHLLQVEKFAKKFIHLIPSELQTNILLGALGHDLIEDARITYNNCVDMFGIFPADIIYACTELRGHNRNERHGKEYIDGLKGNEYALFVKLCDIMANVTFGLATNSSMVSKYKKEFVHFRGTLYLHKYITMFNFLDTIFQIIK